MTLADQTAVITGASSGIGRAIARALARQGTAVCLVGRNRAVLELVAADAQPTSRRVCIYPTDLGVDDDLQRLIVDLQRDMPQIDLVIHSAGAYAMAPFQSATADTLDWLYRVNVRAPYLLTQALLPRLIAQQGQVVFINSSAGLMAKANVSQYAATKHALKAIADSLRDEVNSAGVRVLTVYPGRTATPMQAALFRQEGRPYHPEQLLQPDDVAAAVLNALTLPRTAEITDLNIRPFKKS
ncbi:MAG: SDR family oxidoreductase [Anaerolineae bacterium]|nr:SDR family oxidoreductase [Anaerolineae bacterium]